jgi:hypothetical protein
MYCKELSTWFMGMRAAYLKSKRLLTISEAHVVSNKLQGARNNTFLGKLWLTIGHDLVLPIPRDAGLRKRGGQFHASLIRGTARNVRVFGL